MPPDQFPDRSLTFGLWFPSQCRGEWRIGTRLGLGMNHLGRATTLGSAPEQSAREFKLHGSPLGHENIEMFTQFRNRRTQHQGKQMVVHFFGVPRLGPLFAANPFDGLGVKGGELPSLHREAPPQGHGPGSAFFQGRIVEKGEGTTVQNFMGQRRGFTGIDEAGPDSALLEASDQGLKPHHIHALVETVLHGLPHQGMAGNLDGECDVLLAGRLVGENCRHQVVGFHPLDGWRVAAPTLEAKHHQRSIQIPAPARGKHG